MGQLICASISHTYYRYRYEVGMLKVPANDHHLFASVCIKHGVFQSRRSKRVTCCVAQAFNYNKSDDFFIVARFRVLIPAAMST